MLIKHSIIFRVTKNQLLAVKCELFKIMHLITSLLRVRKCDNCNTKHSLNPSLHILAHTK